MQTELRNDDIYGRLSFAGTDSSGYMLTYASEPLERVSELESSMTGSVETKAEVLSPWIHSILFFRTDESMSPVLEAQVPKGRVRYA